MWFPSWLFSLANGRLFTLLRRRRRFDGSTLKWKARRDAWKEKDTAQTSRQVLWLSHEETCPTFQHSSHIILQCDSVVKSSMTCGGSDDAVAFAVVRNSNHRTWTMSESQRSRRRYNASRQSLSITTMLYLCTIGSLLLTSTVSRWARQACEQARSLSRGESCGASMAFQSLLEAS